MANRTHTRFLSASPPGISRSLARKQSLFAVWTIIAALLIQQSAIARISISPARDSHGLESAIEAGTVFIDPISRTKIVRVTDSRDGQARLASRVDSSSFNLDSSRFFVNLDGVPTLYSFDPSSLTIQKQGFLFGSLPLQFDSCHWSAAETDKVFGLGSVDSASIYAYDTRSGSNILLKDFSGILPNGEAQNLSKSWADDNHFAFTLRESGSSWRFGVVWDRTSDRVYLFDAADPVSGLTAFDDAHLDRSGEALIVNGDVTRVWRYRTQQQSDAVQLESSGDTRALRTMAHDDDAFDLFGSTRPRSFPANDVSRDGRFSIFPSNTDGSRSDMFIAAVNISAVASSVNWTNMVNCTASANSLQKTGGLDQADDAHATSTQGVLSGDAYVEFTAQEADKERWCGLNNSNAIHQSSSDINFAIKLTNNKRANVVENGVVKAKTKYKAGTVLRVAVESGVVNYYKNGSVFYTSTASPTYPLLVNASLVDNMASVSGVMISLLKTGAVMSISPAKAHLTSRSTAQFTAMVTGIDDTITWSATGGSVTSTGLYTAPATAGTYIIRAACASNPTIAASATVSVSASSDRSPPVISGVNVSNVTGNGATISWNTNEASDTQVQYGSTSTYDSTTGLNALMTTSHSAVIAGLSAGTTYHYRVKSKDAAGNLAASADFTFTTSAAAPPPPPPPPPSGEGVLTDHNIRPEPARPPLPRAGGTFVDPTFGTTIMRVTDETDGTSNYNYYSYWPTFNLDSTRFFIACDNNPRLYRFDPNNFQIISKGPLFDQALPGGGHLSTEDAIWSGTNPNVMYSYNGLKLWAYDVSARTYTLVKDFAGELSPGSLGQMSRSLDDNVFAFSKRDANWTVTGYVVWRRDQNRVLRNVTIGNYDEVQIDKSGRYLVVKANFGGGVDCEVVDFQSGSVQRLTDGAPDYSPGHSDTGYGMVMGHDNYNNKYTSRSLATPHQSQTIISFGSDWSQSNHISMLANNEAWCLISNFTSGSFTVGPFRQEIFQASTDGSQNVRRLAHHHSVYRDYWDTPRGDISRDGRFVAFTSNWGSTTRRDVFIIKVPQGAGSAPAPAPGDTTPPAISGVSASASGVVNWTTNETSDTQVEFGTTTAYGSATALNTSMVTSHTATLGGLAAGTLYHYRVRSKDAAGNQAVSGDFNFTTSAGGGGGASTQNVVWTGVVNCSVSGNSLQKTSGRDDDSDAGGASQQQIVSGDGYLQFTAGTTGKIRFCGLTDSVLGTQYAAIDFAIKLTEYGVAEVRENNVYKSETTYAGTDVFRVAIVGGVVKYLKNGVAFYTSGSAPAYPLRADAALLNLNGTVNNAVISAASTGSLAVSSRDDRSVELADAKGSSVLLKGLWLKIARERGVGTILLSRRRAFAQA